MSQYPAVDQAYNNYKAAYDEVTTKSTWTKARADEAWLILLKNIETLCAHAWGYFSPTLDPYSTYQTGRVWEETLEVAELLKNFAPGEITPPTIDTDISDPPSDPAEPEYGTEPVKTDYDIPPVPTLHTFVIPEVPEISIPTFSETIGIDTSVVPTVSIDQGSLQYTSSLLDAIKKKLENDIENGGTGLSSTVEDAIWQRGLERDRQDLADAIDKVEDTFARKAFMLPTGVMAEQITLLVAKWQDQQADRTRDIAIKQAELEQTNIQKRLELAVEIEKVLQDVWDKTQARIVNVSVKIAEYAFETFKAQITKYNASIDAYKAKAEVYKTIIEGEIAKVEAYKARIEGFKAIAQLDEAMVKAYEAEIEGIKALIETYKAEVQAWVAKIEGEKLKIEVYKEKVTAWATETKAIIDVYLGKVDAAKSYYQTYAQLEQVNIGVVDAGVRAYASQINAQASIAEAGGRLSNDARHILVQGLQTLIQTYGHVFSALSNAAATQVHLSSQGSATEQYQEYRSGTL